MIEDDLPWKTFLGKYDLTTVELGEGDYGTWSNDAKPYSYFAAHSAFRYFFSESLPRGHMGDTGCSSQCVKSNMLMREP